MPAIDDLIGVLARRGAALEYLDEVAVAKKRDMAEDLDVSRSTIDRAVRELEDHGLVERVDDGVRLTLAGALVVEEYGRLTSLLEGIDRAGRILASLPSDVELDASLFLGANVTLPSDEDPYAPSKRLAALLDASEFHRALVGAFLPHHVEFYRKHVLDEETETELILTDDVVERLVRDRRDLVQRALDAPNITIRRLERDVPFSLRISSNEERRVVGLLVYGDLSPKGFVETTDAEAVAWATSYLDDRWDEAVPIDATDVSTDSSDSE